MTKKGLSLFVLFIFFFLSCSSDDLLSVDSSDNISNINDNDFFELTDCEIQEDDNDMFDNQLDSVDDDLQEICKHECSQEYSKCVAYNKIESCVFYQNGNCAKKVIKECKDKQGCVKGQCIFEQCSDECIPGEVNGNKKCAYFDIKNNDWRKHKADEFLHDRARQYLWWTDQKASFQGYLTNFYYKNPPEYTIPDHVAGIGDTAIWTGTYLGSEALRYMSTGAYSAEKHMEVLIKRMHRLFKISGIPAILSRFAIKSSVAHSLNYTFEEDCSNTKQWHCNIDYNGEKWDINGHISRDQYQGLLFGYSLAYDALKNREDLRKIIRSDILELVDELIKEREINLEIRI